MTPIDPSSYKLTPPEPSISAEAKFKNRSHWANQIINNFKNKPPITMLDGIVEIFMHYPEGVVSRVCNAMHGLPSRMEFFPSLAELKKALDDTAAELHKQQGKITPSPLVAAEPPPPPEEKPFYTGPIEDIKPGDVLAYDRLDEYDAFMVSRHGIKPRHFGPNDHYVDSGARPFDASKPVETNPFEDVRFTKASPLPQSPQE